MSLINDMLKDLEQRNAGADGRDALRNGVQSAVPLPASGLVGWRRVILLAVLLLAAGVVYLFLPARPGVAPAIPVTPAAPLPQAAAVTAEAAPAEEPQPMSAPASGSPEPAMTAQAETHPPSRLYGLDYALTQPAEPAANAPAGADKAPVPLAAGASAQPAADQGARDLPPPAPAAAPEKTAPPKPSAKPVAAAPLKQVSPQQRADNLYRQAVGLIQQGRVAEAQDALQQALAANASHHEARQLLVGILVDARRNGEAIDLLKAGIAQDGSQTGFRVLLARLLLEAGDRKGALNELQQGVATAGNDAEFHAFYAALLQREERHAEAVQHYLAALSSNPAMPTWLIGIGVSLQAQSQNQDAAVAFQRALDTGKLSPELAQFAEQRVKQLRQLNR